MENDDEPIRRQNAEWSAAGGSHRPTGPSGIAGRRRYSGCVGVPLRRALAAGCVTTLFEENYSHETLLIPTAAAVVLLATATFVAAEKTVTLSVDNMTCASCPFIVKKTLTQVSGVSDVKESLEDMSAVVTFDDTLADVGKLIEAKTYMGHPSQLIE